MGWKGIRILDQNELWSRWWTHLNWNFETPAKWSSIGGGNITCHWQKGTQGRSQFWDDLMNKYSIARKHKPDGGGAGTTCNYVKPILKPECLVAASLLASSVCGHQILASLRAELVALPMHSAQCEFHPAMKQQQHQECDTARQWICRCSYVFLMVKCTPLLLL